MSEEKVPFSEFGFTLADEHKATYETNKQIVEVLQVLKLLAALDPDPSVSDAMKEHPALFVSTAVTASDNVDRIHAAIQGAELDESTKSVCTKTNIALANVVGMMAINLLYEAKMKERMTELADAMITATNPNAETVH